jgi:hypothetical protein
MNTALAFIDFVGIMTCLETLRDYRFQSLFVPIVGGRRSLRKRRGHLAVPVAVDYHGQSFYGGPLELEPPPWRVFPHQSRVSDTPSLSNTTSPKKIMIT